MAVYRVLDGHVVSEGEFRAKQSDLSDFLANRAQGTATSDFGLSGGRFLTARPAEPSSPPTTPEPIQKGSPLTILIREIYTGEFPHGGLFGDGHDIAIVSAVKNYDVFNASTRALNFLVKDSPAHSRLRRPDPFTDGTSLVAYSPAIMTDSLTIGFELAVASFPEDLMNSLSNAFKTVAGIPLLLPYSGYLLGAGELFKLAGNVGHALFDGVKFSVTDSIDFDVIDADPAKPGFRIVAATNEFAHYTYSDKTGLVDPSGKVYSGDSPYIVISLDVKPRDNLKTFAPTVASAAVLQRFFQISDGAQVAVDSIVEGLQFVSDAKYRAQAQSLQEKLKDTTLDGDTRKEYQDELSAALKNIVSDAMRPG